MTQKRRGLARILNTRNNRCLWFARSEIKRLGAVQNVFRKALLGFDNSVVSPAGNFAYRFAGGMFVKPKLKKPSSRKLDSRPKKSFERSRR